jgi:translation initiation factor 2 alpha subunit (eIF-2alpha)
MTTPWYLPDVDELVVVQIKEVSEIMANADVFEYKDALSIIPLTEVGGGRHARVSRKILQQGVITVCRVLRYVFKVFSNWLKTC